MLNKITTSILAFITASVVVTAGAAEVPITGNVASKCMITTDVVGIYGNPTPNVLSTDPQDGGIAPIVRYDVIIADYYKAVIAYPETFSSSPALNDVINWTGSVSVSEVSDPLMSGYEAAKRQYDNVSEFDLTIAGSTWFEINSSATYGFDKALPAGNYRAIVRAECIAL